MARLRYNNQGGLLGAPLTNAGTTVTFGSAPGFATLSGGDYIPLVIEPPAGSTPNPKFEVVYLTAYTAGQTTGTILRGQEGTTAIAHNSGVAWAHGPTALDVTGIPPSRAYRNTALSFGSTAWTKIPLDAVSSDPSGYFNVTTSFRYNVPQAGNYLVNASVARNLAGVSGTTTKDNLVAIYKNGVAVAHGGASYVLLNNNTGAVASVSDMIPCVAGDYLELYAYVDSGDSLLLGAGGFWGPNSSDTFMSVVPLAT